MGVRRAIGVSVLTVMVAASLSAHHGTAQYNAGDPVTLKGTVVEFEWRSPHTQIHVDVRDDTGGVVRWNFEAQPPNVLTRAGWTKSTLQPGDQVTIIGRLAKSGAAVGIIQRVVLASGQELATSAR
jgi:hypothetical protein